MDSSLPPARLLDQAAEALDRADFAAAGSLYRAALAQAGPPQPPALAARARLGLGRVLNEEAQFDEAQSLVESALAPLAGDPLHLAEAETALGEIVSNQGDLEGALDHFQAAYELRLEALGPAHPGTLDSLSMLALFFHVLGEADVASGLIRMAVEQAGHTPQPHAPGIGRVFQRQGRILMDDPAAHEPARLTLERALAIFEAALGPDHPDCGLALNNLANLLTRGEQWDAARPLLLRSLAIHERAYGPQSAFTLFVLANLADVEHHLADLEAAFHFAARALVTAVRSLGPHSPQTLPALRRLVTLLGEQAQAEESGAPRLPAIEMGAMQFAVPFHTCLVALEVAAGLRDPAAEVLTGGRLPPEQAAQRLEAQVERLEALLARPPRSRQELAAQQAALSPARDLAARAAAAMQAGDAAGAYTLYSQALAAQEALLGPHHLEHLPLLPRLAEAAEAAGRPSRVLPLRERAVEILTAILGEDHPETLLAMSNLYGVLLDEYGEQAAEPLRLRIDRLAGQGLGPGNPIEHSLQSLSKLAQSPDPTASPPAADPRQGPSRSERMEAALQSFTDPAGLLSGLDEVDWRSITHAYGPAVDLPPLLKLILSPDPQVREAAWESLSNKVWHQGTLYPATAAVAPFLARLLDDETYPDRAWLMDTLAGFAQDSSYQAIAVRPGSLLVEPALVQAQIERGHPAYAPAPQVLEQVNRAVAGGLPRYVALLDDPAEEMRLLALFTLSRLRDRQAECVPPIHRRLPGYTGAWRAAALAALRALQDAGEIPVAFFTRALSAPGQDPQATFHAAAGVIERLQQAAPPAAVEALLSAWPAARQRLGDGPGGENSLYSTFYEVPADGLQVLACLDPQGVARALERALALMQPPLAADYDLLAVAGALLDRLFDRDTTQGLATLYGSDLVDGVQTPSIRYEWIEPELPRSAGGLTAPQRQALESLLALPVFWRTSHNLLALYGLPESQQALARFLGR